MEFQWESSSKSRAIYHSTRLTHLLVTLFFIYSHPQKSRTIEHLEIWWKKYLSHPGSTFLSMWGPLYSNNPFTDVGLEGNPVLHIIPGFPCTPSPHLMLCRANPGLINLQCIDRGLSNSDPSNAATPISFEARLE